MDKFAEFTDNRNNHYIVERPSGELIWLSKSEMRVLSDYSLIRYDSAKNYWWFTENKRTGIETLLKYERTEVI